MKDNIVLYAVWYFGWEGWEILRVKQNAIANAEDGESSTMGEFAVSDCVCG